MPPLPNPNPNPMPALRSPSPSDSEGEDPTLLLAAGTQSRLRRRPAVAVHVRPDQDSVPPVALFCGAEQQEELPTEEDDWWDAHRPAQIPFLPMPLDDTPPPRPRKRPRTSNGCGARVHAAAHPARAGGRWIGFPEGVAGTVIPLETQYFPSLDSAALGLGRSAGCRACTVEGVGCAVCGNPLGALQTPCRAHRTSTARPNSMGQRHYIFLPCAVSPPISEDVGVGSSR
ncbi:hypothetical protein B0H11DRAFT_1274780 [Mycena galericulata]|nr:hypothetical protein B0H11DRAFT_1274780 [Mycena galericulata]